MVIVELVSDLITNFITHTGYLGVIILMAIESCNIPLPSEIILPFSGYLVYRGVLNIIGVSIAGGIGCVLGSIVSYYLGLWGGRPFIDKYGKYFLLRHRHITWAEKWFAKHGDAAIFFSRLLPVVRTFISFPAGIGKMNMKKFIIYTFIGSVIWSFLLGYIGFLLGPHWSIVMGFFSQFEILLILIAALVIYYLKFRK